MQLALAVAKPISVTNDYTKIRKASVRDIRSTPTFIVSKFTVVRMSSSPLCPMVTASEDQEEDIFSCEPLTDESDLTEEMESAARDLKYKVAQRHKEMDSVVGHLKEALGSVRALSQKMEAIEGFTSITDLSGTLASFMKLEKRALMVSERRRALIERSHHQEVQGLKDQIQHSEGQMIELRTKLNEASSQLASLLKSIDVAPASEEFKDRITAIECWLIHMNEKLSSNANLEENLKLTLEKISLIEKELLESKQQAESLKMELNEVEINKNELAKNLVMANSKIQDLLEETSNQGNQIRSHTLELNRMTEEQSLATDQFTQLSAQQESSIAALEASNRDLGCKVHHLKLRLSQNEKRRIRLVNNLAEMSTTIEQLEIEKRDLQREICSLESSKKEASKDSRMLRETIAKMQSSFSESLIELAEIKCELKKVKSEMESKSNPMPGSDSRQKNSELVQPDPPNGCNEGPNKDVGASDENRSGHIGRLQDEVSDLKALISGLKAELEQEKLRNSKSQAPDAMDSVTPSHEPPNLEELNTQISEKTLEIKNLLEENKDLKEKLVEVFPSLQEQCKKLVEFERDGGYLSDQVMPWESRSELVGLSPLELKAKIWDELTLAERYVLNENCLEEVLEQLAIGNSKSNNPDSDIETPAELDAGSTSANGEVSPAETSVLRTPTKFAWRETRAETVILDESSFFPTPVLNPPTCQRNKRQLTMPAPYEPSNDDLDSSDWARDRPDLMKKPKLVLTNEPKPTTNE